MNTAATNAPDGEKANLLVFVGRPIDLQPHRFLRPPYYERLNKDGTSTIHMRLDSVFDARYGVSQVVFGDYGEPEISFHASDHYGRPAFSKYPVVLLYVSRGENGWYQQKYQYDALYRTVNGTWAGCGAPFEEEIEEYHLQGLHAVPMRFEDASFDISHLTTREIDERYPEPHYEIVGDRAVCVTGASLHDLFEMKKRGVLTATEVFTK